MESPPKNDKNYYELLGLRRDASIDEIKRAFRRIAKQYHPDVDAQSGMIPDASREEQFKLLTFAYHTLTNYDLRKQYDQVLQELASPTIGKGNCDITAIHDKYASAKAEQEGPLDGSAGAQEDSGDQGYTSIADLMNNNGSLMSRLKGLFNGGRKSRR